MPASFSFSSNSLETETYLARSYFTQGAATGVDDPNQFSAVASSQSIDPGGDVDLFAVTLIAGQRYSFDVDTTGGIDLELDLIDQRGLLVTTQDGGTGDPRFTIDVARTGTYFVAVHQAQNNYVNGGFTFVTPNASTGSYSFNISTPSLPPLVNLTEFADRRTFTDFGQNVNGRAGSDQLYLQGGNDIALGGSGNDTLNGGDGSDELNGDTGSDRLIGDVGDDVMIGGADRDFLYGGSGNDAFSAGSGNDALYGGTSNDTLWGQAGNDTIVGDSGNDFIRGGAGADLLYGSTGLDTFHFLRGDSPYVSFQRDVIADFQDGDTIDLTDLLLGTLSFRGAAAFTGANQVRVVDVGSGYQDVRVNLDSDTSTVELSVLVDSSPLYSSDFEL